MSMKVSHVRLITALWMLAALALVLAGCGSRSRQAAPPQQPAVSKVVLEHRQAGEYYRFRTVPGKQGLELMAADTRFTPPVRVRVAYDASYGNRSCGENLLIRLLSIDGISYTSEKFVLPADYTLAQAPGALQNVVNKVLEQCATAQRIYLYCPVAGCMAPMGKPAANATGPEYLLLARAQGWRPVLHRLAAHELQQRHDGELARFEHRRLLRVETGLGTRTVDGGEMRLKGALRVAKSLEFDGFMYSVVSTQRSVMDLPVSTEWWPMMFKGQFHLLPPKEKGVGYTAQYVGVGYWYGFAGGSPCKQQRHGHPQWGSIEIFLDEGKSHFAASFCTEPLTSQDAIHKAQGMRREPQPGPGENILGGYFFPREELGWTDKDRLYGFFQPSPGQHVQPDAAEQAARDAKTKEALDAARRRLGQ